MTCEKRMEFYRVGVSVHGVLCTLPHKLWLTWRRMKRSDEFRKNSRSVSSRSFSDPSGGQPAISISSSPSSLQFYRSKDPADL